MRHLLLAAALVAAVGNSLAAQRLGPPADRPRLRDVSDTNDAQAYYQMGLDLFERDPGQASAAFYWAARINPGWGEPLYARRAALMMNDSRLLRQYFESRRNTSSEQRRLDSLQFRALMLSPFLYRRLDRVMLTSYIREDVTRRSRMGGGGEPSRAELEYHIESYLHTAGPSMRAWLAYGSGDFAAALRYYALSLGNTRNAANVHLERGRIFRMQGEADSAMSELHVALEELRKQDDKELVVFYDSKALAEYSIAVLLEGAGNTEGARESYGRALQEDLAYYPAHMRLGLLALGKGDTATAVSELALAAQIAGDEPHIRYVNGYVLAAAKRYPEALTELRRSVELEPYYALPYLRLGQVYEQLGKAPEALASYQGFLDRSSQREAQREFATQRMAELKDYLKPLAP